ncbi:uncharacterized protein LOC111714349 isoform X2 [Eurytemora carolleeae]|uniref:uncharacterized protein LOC111714349 isoform X2 n=1 Tax=Eurytemora carolleeae TaxID=1294199 RepID=UPI000C7781FC|nr:uncharacterized protein LOC111714349 isoform X2 [Eurytemora carolleeae]|eukprot:XP_023345208.1 uncharacterized protein LOC111714349 isoform X2 [Eurytemora affinis]
MLHGSAISALVVPLGFVLLFNFVVVIIVLDISYKVLRIRISKRSGGITDAKPETKLLFHTMVKNTFRLSFLLGLPWFVGLLSTNTTQQYATVILNSCSGFYIFFYSIVEDPKVMPEGKKKCRAMITMFWNRLQVLAELCRDMFALFWNRFQVRAELRDLLLSCCTRYEHYKLWDYLYLTSLQNLLRRILRSPRKIEQSHQSQKSKPLSQEFEPSSEQDEVYSLETEFSTEGLSSYC